MLREAGRAGRRLLRARQRLVALLVAADRNMEGSIAGEELVTILGRVGVALTPECSQALIQALLREGGGGGEGGGKVDYRRMVAAIGGKGEEEKEEGLVSLLRQHLDRRDIPASSPGTPHGSPISDALPLVERLSDDDPLVRSTMRDGSAQAQREGGAHGEAVESCKKEQLRQFAVLLDYCRRNGVVLSKELAERGMLSMVHSDTHTYMYMCTTHKPHTYYNSGTGEKYNISDVYYIQHRSTSTCVTL